MIEVHFDWDASVKAVVVAIFSVASTILTLFARSKLKRMWSKDQVEVASDLSEIDLLSKIQEERREWRERERELMERVDKAYDERNDAMEELGSLKKEVSILTGHVNKLENQVKDLQARIETLIKLTGSLGS